MKQTHDIKLKKELGDFQTPIELARQVCSTLKSHSNCFKTIIEPTCGIGNFLISAIDEFQPPKSIGIDINTIYINETKKRLAKLTKTTELLLLTHDFFSYNWNELLPTIEDPILIVGNPPWVTNSDIGSLGGTNLPPKSNLHRHLGFDAITGKGNFDISEWMIIRLLEVFQNRNAVVAMLCKTAVARRIVAYAANNQLHFTDARVYLIDAKEYFNAAVDACLFLFSISDINPTYEYKVYHSFDRDRYERIVGYRNGEIVNDIEAYEKYAFLRGRSNVPWRSGLKHDCAKIMEFNRIDGVLYNGLGECVSLEPTYLYPLLKSSDLANNRTELNERWVLVPQQSIGDETKPIETLAPQTWSYLQAHHEYFKNRASSIYKNQPEFSIFGIGPYSFSMWKVAISGLYKKSHFVVVSPRHDKPVMLDDTCYFISCGNRVEAEVICRCLNSNPVREYLSSIICWDSKRPITKQILQQIDISKIMDRYHSLNVSIEDLHISINDINRIIEKYTQASRTKQLQLF